MLSYSLNFAFLSCICSGVSAFSIFVCAGWFLIREWSNFCNAYEAAIQTPGFGGVGKYVSTAAPTVYITPCLRVIISSNGLTSFWYPRCASAVAMIASLGVDMLIHLFWTGKLWAICIRCVRASDIVIAAAFSWRPVSAECAPWKRNERSCRD